MRVWKEMVTRDNRDNEVLVADPTSPHEVRGWAIPQRSSAAAVPGQQKINIVRIGVAAHLTDVGLWSRVEWDGKTWDVAAPPGYRHGTRQTRHWSIDIRERP